MNAAASVPERRPGGRSHAPAHAASLTPHMPHRVPSAPVPPREEQGADGLPLSSRGSARCLAN